MRLSQQKQVVEDVFLEHCGLSPIKCWAAAAQHVSGVPLALFEDIIYAKEDYQEVGFVKLF